ncbi:Uncharacterised protein [Vibrio cholerae]|nr:Uncharacterised protein [Vibrio cholerae]
MLNSWLFAFHVSHHQLVILLNSSFDHHFTVFFYLINHVCWNFFHFEVFWKT